MKIPNLEICKNNNYYNLYNKKNRLILGYYFDIIDIKYKNNNIYLKVNNLNNNFINDINFLKTIIDIKLNINIKFKKDYFFLVINSKDENNIFLNNEKINLIKFFNMIIEKKYLFNINFYPILKKKHNKYYFKFIINSIYTTNDLFLNNCKTIHNLLENDEIIQSPI